MKQNDLKEYINILADMENHIFLQKTLIQNLNTYSSSLGKPERIDKPEKPTQITGDRIGYGWAVVLIAAGVLLIRWGLKLAVAPGVMAFLGSLLSILFGGCLVLYGLIFIPVAISSKHEGRKSDLEHSKKMQDYDASVAQYHKRLSAEEERLKKEEREKGLIDAEIEAAESHLVQSKEHLQDMYALDVVYPKYRNMVMINSICEYLTSGRCSALDGESGAYNILETEMRLDRIILQLDQIIENLDQIKQTQYMLYSAVEQGNRKADEIAQSIKALSTKLDNLQVQERDYSQALSKLQAASGLTAYNTERIRKELHYMNRMKYFAGEYNGTVFNQLP